MMDSNLYKQELEPPVLSPAKLIISYDEKYSLKNRLWQGCPTIARIPEGRLWAGWYSGGTREPHEDNYNLLVYSDDSGVNWSDPVLIVDSVPEIFLRAMDIQLWLDPYNKLWVFWTQTRDSSFKNENGHNLAYTDDVFGTWAINTAETDSNSPSWSEPVRISDGFLRCRPTVLNNGRWIVCAYDWLCNKFAYTISDDNGQTWRRIYGAVKTYEGRCFDETMIVQRLDGSLWSLSRTKQGRLAQTFSFDNGDTWTPSGFSLFETPSSRFWIDRLKSGNLLMIHHYEFTGRSHMTAMLSDDDGYTWKYKLLLDERAGVSYPDAVEYPDGSVMIIYDRGRTTDKEILTAYITEEDIKAGKLVNEKSHLTKIISKAP